MNERTEFIMIPTHTMQRERYKHFPALVVHSDYFRNARMKNVLGYNKQIAK